MTHRSEDQMSSITIPVPQEFSFTQNLDYLSRASNECMHRIQNQRVYKAIPIDEDTFIVEISAEPSDSVPQLTLRFLGNRTPSHPSGHDKVIHYVRDWFDLDTDLQPFYQLAKHDPLLENAVRSFYGLRNMGIPDLFEALCWGIIGQQINLTFAYTLKRRLVEGFGQRVEHDGETYWVFPTPQDVAALKVEDLTKLQMTTKKSEYLIGVAQLMAEGKLTKQGLLDIGDHKQTEKMLTSIRGIGPWTANYVFMRCLRIPTAFPIDDVGLHNAIKVVTGSEAKPTKEEILRFSARWTNWEAYATFYLWRFLY